MPVNFLDQNLSRLFPIHQVLVIERENPAAAAAIGAAADNWDL